ncbi:MAG: hypothetical protein ABEJ43_10700 [Haloferacaceae archaeon]
MARLASDAVESARATVARSGGPRSRLLRLPAALDATAGDTVRVSLDDDGTTTDGFARVDADTKGPYLAGVYANRRLARTDDEGENLLAPLLAARDPGSSLVLDVLDAGHHYGIRRPGDRVVYEVPERRDDSLAAIADRVEDTE